MYQLYCAPNTYAMGVHVLLQELQVDYEIIEVELFTEHPSAEFVEASPHARVPAIKHGHGTVFESGAIALFLTDRHADKGFTVSPDHQRRAHYLQWLFYLSSTVQPEVIIQFHPEFYVNDPEQQLQMKSGSMDRLLKVWEVLNQAYADGPYLFGHPTAVDFCLAAQLQWEQCFDNGIASYPNLARTLSEVSGRGAWRKVLNWHQRSAHAS